MSDYFDRRRPFAANQQSDWAACWKWRAFSAIKQDYSNFHMELTRSAGLGNGFLHSHSLPFTRSHFLFFGLETMFPHQRQFDGGKNRGGSTSVRGRVRSPHISGGRWWLSCRQPDSLGSCAMGQTDGRTWTDGSRYSKMPPMAGHNNAEAS